MLEPYSRILLDLLIKLVYGQETNEKSFQISQLNTRINFLETNASVNSILQFLVLAGYLTYEEATNKRGRVWIPNTEVLSSWASLVKSLFDDIFSIEFQEKLVLALVSFDTPEIEKCMKEMLDTLSYYNANTEDAYHTYFLGMFDLLCQGHEDMEVSSNKKRNSDILIEFTRAKKLVIFEFKNSTQDDSSSMTDILEIDAKKALQQIENKNCYLADKKEYDCLLVGVAYCGNKRISLCCKEVNALGNQKRKM
jgi:hypothetical protein